MEEQRKIQAEQNAAQMANMTNMYSTQATESPTSPSDQAQQYGYPAQGNYADPNMVAQGGYMTQQAQQASMYSYQTTTGAYPSYPAMGCK